MDSLKLARVGDTIVVMVELYPSAYMLALSAEQAETLGRNLLEILKTEGGTDTDDLPGLMMKKPKGAAS